MTTTPEPETGPHPAAEPEAAAAADPVAPEPAAPPAPTPGWRSRRPAPRLALALIGAFLAGSVVTAAVGITVAVAHDHEGSPERRSGDERGWGRDVDRHGRGGGDDRRQERGRDGGRDGRDRPGDDTPPPAPASPTAVPSAVPSVVPSPSAS